MARIARCSTEAATRKSRRERRETRELKPTMKTCILDARIKYVITRTRGRRRVFDLLFFRLSFLNPAENSRFF